MSFEGEIGEIDLVQRLVELGREHFTGAIRFEQDGIIKIVYFKGGDVLSASTNDRTDAVDEILLRAGKVDKEHVKQALARRKENESLGDALLNLGFITRKELTWGRRIQVIGILRSVRTWTHGQYAIVADYLPKREEGTLFPLQQILIELFVTDQDRSPFERALEGGSAVLEKTPDFDLAFARLGLNEDASEIARKIDGKRTAAEIAAITGKDVFNTYKLLEALRALGLLRKLESKAEVKDELAFASVGVADAADAWSSGKMPAFQLENEPPVQPAMEVGAASAADASRCAMGIRRSANRDGEQGRRRATACARADTSQRDADADATDAAEGDAPRAEEDAWRSGLPDDRSSDRRSGGIRGVVVLEAVERRAAADPGLAAGEKGAGDCDSRRPAPAPVPSASSRPVPAPQPVIARTSRQRLPSPHGRGWPKAG